MARTLRMRAFQSWFRFSRSMTLGVRGIVEDENGRVLMVRHTYTPGLYFPGGGVERGEVSESSLHRELIEEAGVESLERPELLGVYSNARAFPNDHVLLYRVGAWRSVPPQSTGEISEVVWIDPRDPPGDLTPGTARRVAEVYGGAKVDPYW